MVTIRVFILRFDEMFLFMIDNSGLIVEPAVVGRHSRAVIASCQWQPGRIAVPATQPVALGSPGRHWRWCSRVWWAKCCRWAPVLH